MTKNKYIIVEKFELPLAILIPDSVQHSEAINQPNLKPISAGFWQWNADGTVHVFGDSTSLKLQSRKEDAGIIQDTLFLMGFKQPATTAIAA